MEGLYAPNGAVLSSSAVGSQAAVYLLQEGATATDAVITALLYAWATRQVGDAWNLTGLTGAARSQPNGFSLRGDSVPKFLECLHALGLHGGVRSLYDLVRLCPDSFPEDRLPAWQTVADTDFTKLGSEIFHPLSLESDDHGAAVYRVGDRHDEKASENHYGALAFDHRGNLASLLLSASDDQTAGHLVEVEDGRVACLSSVACIEVHWAVGVIRAAPGVSSWSAAVY